MLQAIINWWRGYSKADMESVKERLSYPNNSGSISIHVTNPERRALRDLIAQSAQAERSKLEAFK